MDVGLTEEQELLRTSARDFLAAECPIDLVRKGVDPADEPPHIGHAEPLWRAMAELGWMGLVVPEARGGAGLGWVDLAVLLEEMGRALLPAPFLSTVVLGGQAIALAGSDAQCDDLLPKIASGALRVTLAQSEASGDWKPEAVQLAATGTGGGYSLTGRKFFVPDAETAELFVVAARSSEGLVLALVERDAPGLEIRRIDVVDRTRPLYELTLTDVGAREWLGTPSDAEDALALVNDLARVAIAAEACGGAQWALDAAVAYAGTREQFGKPIGSFQAIAHKCADIFVRVESARSAAYYAAWAAAAGEQEAHVSACMAKAYCADAYALAAAQAIQIHGGLGFTWEQDLHLYYKRAKACQLAFGDSAFTRELAARVLVDGAAPPAPRPGTGMNRS